MSKICGIYSIYCTESKKIYVGSTRNFKKRNAEHKKKMKGGWHPNQHLQSSWNLYGKDSFIFSILEICDEDISRYDLEKLEEKWILYYSAHKKETGFNKCLPGTIPLRGEDENQTSLNRGASNIKSIICLDISTKEIIEYKSGWEAAKEAGMPLNKMADYTSYWKKGRGKKSYKGKIYIKKEAYNPDFDYISYDGRINKRLDI